MNIPVAVIAAAVGCPSSLAEEWQPYFEDACERYEINTPRRVCALLSNVGVESGGLTRLVENLNYSAQGLADTWPTRYAVDANAKTKLPNALAKRLERRPEAIANLTYANRMGNGPEASGDGCRYRGRGPIQNTGRDAYGRLGAALGYDFVADPDALASQKYGALAAAWFFADKGCNALADAGNVTEIVRRVNGKPPSASNHGPLRLDRYEGSLWLAYQLMA